VALDLVHNQTVGFGRSHIDLGLADATSLLNTDISSNAAVFLLFTKNCRVCETVALIAGIVNLNSAPVSCSTDCHGGYPIADL
jgi:hypothetical protein